MKKSSSTICLLNIHSGQAILMPFPEKVIKSGFSKKGHSFAIASIVSNEKETIITILHNTIISEKTYIESILKWPYDRIQPRLLNIGDILTKVKFAYQRFK